MIYKVSYVVTGGTHPGAIINQEEPPQVGDQVRLKDDRFEIVEVIDLLPAHDDFAYVHVTCRPVQQAT